MSKSKSSVHISPVATDTFQEIDWADIERRVRSISRYGDEGVRLIASPEEVLAIAAVLADIYRRAGRPLPDALAALL